MLDRRASYKSRTPHRDQSQHFRARSNYDEETSYESYMNLESG